MIVGLALKGLLQLHELDSIQKLFLIPKIFSNDKNGYSLNWSLLVSLDILQSPHFKKESKSKMVFVVKFPFYSKHTMVLKDIL